MTAAEWIKEQIEDEQEASEPTVTFSKATGYIATMTISAMPKGQMVGWNAIDQTIQPHTKTIRCRGNSAEQATKRVKAYAHKQMMAHEKQDSFYSSDGFINSRDMDYYATS
ncbi:MAG: hypothetical protein WC455_19155 [Dehalococcoidia bacterium]|jgi:hypothetical protein